MKGQTKLKSQKNIYDNEELLVKVKSSNLLDFFELDESYKENVQQHLNNQNLKTSMKTFLRSSLTSHFDLCIDLENNKLGESDKQDLSSALSSCINISSLTVILSYGQITAQIPQIIISALEKTNIYKFKMKFQPYNYFVAWDCFDIDSALAKCTSLYILEISFSYNGINSNNKDTFGLAFEKFVNLSSLKLGLYEQSLNDDVILELFSALENCKNLQTLVLKLLYKTKENRGTLRNIVQMILNYSKLSVLSLTIRTDKYSLPNKRNLQSKLRKMKKMVHFSV
ncbi:hypothetical protein ABPG74_006690 [Tetrahymena malaccensis]